MKNMIEEFNLRGMCLRSLIRGFDLRGKEFDLGFGFEFEDII